jgi:hypothetical protein
MMDELVRKLSEKTGLTPEKSQEVVTFVVNQLKEKLPAPFASGLDNLLAGGPAGTTNWVDEAKAVAIGLGGLFGNKA